MEMVFSHIALVQTNVLQMVLSGPVLIAGIVMLFVSLSLAGGFLPGTFACIFLAQAFKLHHGIEEGCWAPQLPP